MKRSSFLSDSRAIKNSKKPSLAKILWIDNFTKKWVKKWNGSRNNNDHPLSRCILKPAASVNECF